MLLVGNNKSTVPVFLAVLFMLFIMAGLPGTSISADEDAGKQEVKKEGGWNPQQAGQEEGRVPGVRWEERRTDNHGRRRVYS